MAPSSNVCPRLPNLGWSQSRDQQHRRLLIFECIYPGGIRAKAQRPSGHGLDFRRRPYRRRGQRLQCEAGSPCCGAERAVPSVKAKWPPWVGWPGYYSSRHKRLLSAVIADDPTTRWVPPKVRAINECSRRPTVAAISPRRNAAVVCLRPGHPLKRLLPELSRKWGHGFPLCEVQARMRPAVTPRTYTLKTGHIDLLRRHLCQTHQVEYRTPKQTIWVAERLG